MFTGPARSCLMQLSQVYSPVRVFFSSSQVCRACSLKPIATLPGLLTCASLLFCFEISLSLLTRTSCNLAGSAHQCEFTFLLSKFTEHARSCLFQPCWVCSPVRVYFSALNVRRACSLVPLATLPGLLTRASLRFCLASLPSLLAPPSCNPAGKFAEPARSSLLQPCRVCSPVRVYYSASHVRRASSLVPLATLPGLLTRASLLFYLESSPSLLARASCNLAGSAHPCEFTFLLRKFTGPARSCLMQLSQVYSPVRVFFSASQVRRACSLKPVATLPGLLTCASLLFCFEISLSLLARTSCNLAGSDNQCGFTFLLSKFTEHARSCLFQPCWKVPRACSLVLLATLPGLLARASLLFCFACSPSLLARASCNLARSAHPCELTFLLRKFVQPARSCLLQPCRVCSPVRVNFSASQVRPACSLVPLATLAGLLTRASLFFCFASSSSLLARASCNLAKSAHPCEFTFLLRKFTRPARSCLMQLSQVYSPVRVFFSASQVRPACSLVPLATLAGLLTRASFLFCFASSPSLLAQACCNLARSAHLCEFTFLLRNFTEPARSYLLQPCRVCSPFAEPARSCLLQPCRVCSPVRVYYSASHVRRASSLVSLASLLGLLTHASLLFCLASSPSMLPRASYNIADSAHPCELSFLLRKFVEPARSCVLQPRRVCSPVLFYLSASKVRRACSLVPLATLPGLLTRASLRFCLASLPSLLAPPSCNPAGSAHPSEFTILLLMFAGLPRSKFAEPARSSLLQPCRVCSPVRVYYSASHVRRASSLVPLATLPGLLTRASLRFCLASLPSLLAPPSCNPAGSAHPSEFTILLLMFAGLPRSCLLQPCRFTFLLSKFAEPARSSLLQPCRVCSPVRVYYSASHVRRASSLVPLATLPGLLTRASLRFCLASLPSLLAPPSCNPAGSAHPSEFTILLLMFAGLPRSCLLQPCRFTFLLSKFAEPARSSLLQPCRVCSPVRVYYSASHVRRASSLVPLASLPGLLTRASLLFCLASSPNMLARASYNIAGSAHPCELSFLLRKFVEPARSCVLQPRRVCSPVLFYLSASKVRRACSLVPLATLPGLLTDGSLLFCLESSPSLLARASCNLAGSAHPCEFTFVLRKLAEPPPFCLLQPCRVCSPVRVYFCATQVRRACSPLPLTTVPGLLTHASLLFYFGSSPSQLAPASYNLAWSALPCEFTFPRSKFARASCNFACSARPSELTFPLSKFAEPAGSCLLQPCRVCSPVRVNFFASQYRLPAGSCLLLLCRVCSSVRVNFSASQVRRACSLVPLATLPGLLTRASLIFCFGNSPSQLAAAPCNLAGPAHPSLLFSLVSSSSLLARASCNLAGSTHPCEFNFLLRKFPEPARCCPLQPCRACSPEFTFQLIRRACSLVPLATLPGLLTRASLLFCFESSPSLLARASCNLAGSAHPCELTFLLRKFVEPARSCLLQPCRVCSTVRVNFSASKVRRACLLVPLATLPGLLTRASLLFSLKVPRACSLVPLATMPGLLTRASYLSSFASSSRLLTRASCNLAGSAHPCAFTFLLRKFVEAARSCLMQPCRVSSPMRVYFSTSEVRRANTLVPLASLPGLLTHAHLLFCFASSSSLLARASCNLAESTHPCDLSFQLRKFVEAARSCLMQPCRVSSPMRVYFSTSEVRRANTLVPLASLPGLLTHAHLLFCFASSSSLLARASCNLAESTHPCDLSFQLRKFVEAARSCLMQPCRVSSPMRVYFSTSEVRRANTLVPLASLPGLLTHAHLLFCFASSSSLLARASCNLAESTHPCDLSFQLRKFVEAARSCLMQPCRVSSPMRVYFSTSEVRRANTLVPLASLPGLLTHAHLLFCFASSSSLLARASCNLAESTHPCDLSFQLRKFVEAARSCLMQPCRVSSPMRVYFSTSEVRRANTLVPLASLPGLLTHAHLLFCFASSSSLLARASCNLAESTHPCDLSFQLRKFVEAARSCLMQPCRVSSPMRVYFSTSEVRRANTLVPLASLPGLLTHAHLLFCFASSSSLLARASCNLAESTHPCDLSFQLRKFVEAARSCLMQPCRDLLTRATYLSSFASSSRLLARASCNLDGSAHPCEFTFLLRKFAEPARSCLLQPCRVCSPDLLTRATYLSSFASSSRLLARASCNLAGSTHPCEFTFVLRKLAEPPLLCLLQPCLVCSPMRAYFSTSEVRRANSLLHRTTLPGLLYRASLLFCFASSSRLLARASCYLAGSARPCELTFLLRKFVEAARSCLLLPCRVCSPVRVNFSATQVRRACSLVPLATLPGLLSVRVNFPASQKVHTACWLVPLATLPGLLSVRVNFPASQVRRACSLVPLATLPGLLSVRVNFPASQVRRACSLVPLATSPGLLTRASLLFCFGSSPSQLALAPVNLAWPAHPCEFTFLLCKFVEPARSCLMQPCRVCSPVRVYFSALQVRRACSLVPLATFPGLLTRASLLFCFASLPSLLARASLLFYLESSPSQLARVSCNHAGSAHPWEFTFLLRKFVEPARACLLRPCPFVKPARLCLLQPCRVCSPVRVYFSASQVRRACSLKPVATLLGLLTCASSLCCFARTSCNLAGSTYRCEFTLLLRKFPEPARSCPCQPCLACSPVRVYFSALKVRRACSLVPLATLPVLLTRASLLFCFGSSPSQLALAPVNLAWPAHPCEFTFLLRKFTGPARSCLMQLSQVCSPVRVFFSASQVRRACSLKPVATLLGLLTCASSLCCFARTSCNLAGSTYPCEFTFLLRKFPEPARSCPCQPCLACSPPSLLTRASFLFCFASSPSLLAQACCNLARSAHLCEFTLLLRSYLLQPCRVYLPVRVYFSASEVPRASSLLPLSTLPGLLTRASLLFCFASSPGLLDPASCNLAKSAHPCEFSFLLRKFAELARSSLLQPCSVCSPVRVHFAASLVPLATLPGLLTRASLLFCFGSSPSQLALAPVNLAWPAHPCEFTFLLRKFTGPARSCLMQLSQVCSPVRVFFSASQVRRACSLKPVATLLGLLTCASSLCCFARTSCNLAGSTYPCEFTFLLRKFPEPARCCPLQPCRACSPQVCRACSLLPLATLPGLLTCPSLLFCFSCSPGFLARASCIPAGSAHPCEFTFLLSKFTEHARSCLLQHCWVCPPVRVIFSASQVRRACSLVPLATLEGLLTRASLLSSTASSPSHLARASCNLGGSANPCEFTFQHRKFAEPPRSCLLQPWRKVPRACSLVSLATMPGLLTPGSLLFCFESSSSLLARASCNLAGSAHPCEFTFLLRKFPQPARSCLLQPCRVYSPLGVYFSASKVRRACSRLPLATLPGLLTRASLPFYLESSPSLLARVSCNHAGSTHPWEFTFLLRKFVEPARACLLRPCPVCSPVRVYFCTLQVRRACSLGPLATLPGLLTRASSLFYLESSPSLLARASCNLAGSAHPCELTFLLRKFVEPARSCLLQPCRVCSPFAEPSRSCLLQPCRVCSPVRVYFSAYEVRRACSLVPLATLPGLLTDASLLFCLRSSPSLLARASCNLAGSAHRCEFTFLLTKFAEPARSCLLQPCRVCSPMRVYFSAYEVRRACSLVPLATLPGLLTDASLLFCLRSSPSLLARASCNLAGSAHRCEFTFLLTKFAEPARSCLLQPCRVCSPMRVYFSAYEVRRACSLVPLATLPGLLTDASLLFCLRSSPSLLARASCNLAGSAHRCEFTFLLTKFAEPARSCLLQPCRVCSPMRVYFSAYEVRRACSLVPLATLPGLLTDASLLFCLRSSPSLLARASCNLAGSAHRCEFTFLLTKFAEPARSCLLQPCRVCSPMRVYFSAYEVRRACSLVPLATLPGLLTDASLLFCLESSPSLLARASCILAGSPSQLAPASYNLAWSALPCEFTFPRSKFALASCNFACSARPSELTFPLRKFAEPAGSCLLQPCRVCSPVRVNFSASQVRRACSLVPLATFPGLLTRASLLFCNLAGSANPCEFTFLHRKIAEPPRSCLLQPCRVYSPVRVYFSASEVPRASSLLPLATLPGLLTRASLLFSLFTFLHRKIAEPPRSCLLQPCRVYSPVRVYFSASEVPRASSLLPLATLPGLLTRASLLFSLVSSSSLLARASCKLARWPGLLTRASLLFCNLAGSANPCEFTFLHRKIAEPPRSCLLQPCRVYSPVRVYFSASEVPRASSLLPLATLPGLLTRASLLFSLASSSSLLARASCNLAGSAHPCEFTFLLRKFTRPARSCLMQLSQVYSPFVPLATLPGLLTRAILPFCFESSPSLLVRASCNLAGSAHPCYFTFLLRKFAEPASSCLLQPCRVCSHVQVNFSASQVRRACSLVPLATLPGLLTRASLLFCFASSPGLLDPASCNLAKSTHPCEFSFLLRKFTGPARSCLMQLSQVYSPPSLLTRASFLFCFASSPSLLAQACCNLSRSSHLCEFTFLLRNFAEPARSYLLQPCRVYLPVRVYFSASEVPRASSLLPLSTLPGLLTRASLLFSLASSSSLLARASCNLARSAHPCEFTFQLSKFVEPTRSCLLQPCRVYLPVRVYFSASQVRRVCSLVPLATLPVPRACSLVSLATMPGLLTRASLLFSFASSSSQLARASCNLAGSAHPCEFTFLLRKFPEPAHSCLLQPCLVCSPLRVNFSASQVRRACSLVPLATLPGLLTRESLLFCFASSPGLLDPASCNLAKSAHPCEFSFLLRKFAELARSSLWQPCPVCSPVRVYFSASKFRRACSLVPLATLPGLLTSASLLFCLASSPSMLARASSNLAGSAHPCEFTFLLRKFTGPARSCLMQLSQVYSPVRVFFSASQVRSACSLKPVATLPGLLTCTSLLFCFDISSSLLARASCNLAGSAHQCEFTFLLSKFTEHARSCLFQPCWVCSPVRVYFCALKVRRACSLVPLATLPGLLTRASLRFCLASLPSLLAPPSCNPAGPAHPSEFTILLLMFAGLPRSCLLHPCRVCSPVLVYVFA
ncbi:hypothetical protein CRG98_017335 [Punica granatum]|uniref:Uncharacterized protein n=1 Tax=Punica granatum TaxID=22663 RepID=A0A2I0K128_PUNGR|nr:hypothetical protein CRG98_017335 [Punica granatum]